MAAIQNLVLTFCPKMRCVPHNFVQKRKILKRSACESKTIKGSIHVFTQEGNQCGLSLLAFLILMHSRQCPARPVKTQSAHLKTMQTHLPAHVLPETKA